MAQRRMFSPDIVESDEFMTMPVSSQALYFHLGMHADDDGFVQPRVIMRAGGFAEDDLKVLLAKRFLLAFETGVVVIKHWLIHNLIRSDRYKETRFIEEKKRLTIKENRAYTDNKQLGCQNDNQRLPQVRLGKVRLSKVISNTLNDQIEPLKNRYAPSMITDFILYWDEKDQKGTERWKKEKTWEIEKRLIKWKRNQEKWDQEKTARSQLKNVNEMPTRSDNPIVRENTGFSKISFEHIE